MRKLIYSVVALSTLMTAPGAFAKIHPIAFKGVTKHFRKGKEFLSPTLGEAALESGLMSDLRFFGNFKAAYTKDHKRDYINDSPNDPLWALQKIFFPSSGGNLSEQSIAAFNFGKNVQSPKTVALLLNFANDLRENKKVDKKKLTDAILESLQKTFHNTTESLTEKKDFIKNLEDLPIPNSMTKNDCNRLMKCILI